MKYFELDPLFAVLLNLTTIQSYAQVTITCNTVESTILHCLKTANEWICELTLGVGSALVSFLDDDDEYDSVADDEQLDAPVNYAYLQSGHLHDLLSLVAEQVLCHPTCHPAHLTYENPNNTSM